MSNFRDIIDAWPSLAEFAADLGVTTNTAKQMRTRDSIPADYWLRVVEGARKRGIPGVALAVLADLRAANPRKRADDDCHAA